MQAKFLILLISTVMILSFLSCWTIDQQIINSHNEIILKVLSNPKILYNNIQTANCYYSPGKCTVCVDKYVNTIEKYFPFNNYYRTISYPFDWKGDCEDIFIKSTKEEERYIIFSFCRKNRNDSMWIMNILFNDRAEKLDSID